MDIEGQFVELNKKTTKINIKLNKNKDVNQREMICPFKTINNDHDVLI